MAFLSKYRIQQSSKHQIHVHDICLSHCNSEQVFETSCQDDSFQKDLNVQMIIEFRMIVNLSQVSHVETLFVESLRDAFTVCQESRPIIFQAVDDIGYGFIDDELCHLFQQFFLFWCVLIFYEMYFSANVTINSAHFLILVNFMSFEGFDQFWSEDACFILNFRIVQVSWRKS